MEPLLLTSMYVPLWSESLLHRAEARGSKAPIDGIKVDGESAFEVVLAEVKVKINLLPFVPLMLMPGQLSEKLVVGISCTDVVPPCIGSED